MIGNKTPLAYVCHLLTNQHSSMTGCLDQLRAKIIHTGTTET